MKTVENVTEVQAVLKECMEKLEAMQEANSQSVNAQGVDKEQNWRRLKNFWKRNLSSRMISYIGKM